MVTVPLSGYLLPRSTIRHERSAAYSSILLTCLHILDYSYLTPFCNPLSLIKSILLVYLLPPPPPHPPGGPSSLAHLSQLCNYIHSETFFRHVCARCGHVLFSIITDGSARRSSRAHLLQKCAPGRRTEYFFLF